MYNICYNIIVIKKGCDKVPIKYDKLFRLLKERGVTTYQIRKEKIISESSLQKLREGKPISTSTIERMCDLLDCQPGDIMEYVKEE